MSEGRIIPNDFAKHLQYNAPCRVLPMATGVGGLDALQGDGLPPSSSPAAPQEDLRKVRRELVSLALSINATLRAATLSGHRVGAPFVIENGIVTGQQKWSDSDLFASDLRLTPLGVALVKVRCEDAAVPTDTEALAHDLQLDAGPAGLTGDYPLTARDRSRIRQFVLATEMGRWAP